MENNRFFRESKNTIAYQGSAEEILGLAINNYFLNLLTLGFYSFWARMRLRRYFCRNFIIDGSAAEYYGTGDEVFKNALLWLIALVPLMSILQTFGLIYFEPLTWLSFLLLFGLYCYALYARFSFNCSRLRWRGLRFSLTALAKPTSLRLAANMLMSIASLGLLYPLALRNNLRYLLSHTKFENQALQASLPVKPLILPHLTTYLFLIAIIWAFIDQYKNPQALAPFASLFLIILPLMLCAFASRLWFQARLITSVINALRLGGVHFQCRLGFGTMARLAVETLAWTFALFMILSFIFIFLIVLVFFVIIISKGMDPSQLAAATGDEHIKAMPGKAMPIPLEIFISIGLAYGLGILFTVRAIIAPLMQHRFFTLVQGKIKVFGLESLQVNRDPELKTSTHNEGLAWLFKIVGLGL